MKFSLAAFSATVVGVVLSGVASFVEGTFTNRRVTIGFLNHGGMWSDLLVMSVVTGFVFPYLSRSRVLAVASLLLALAITILAHQRWAAWGRTDAVTGHIFPTHETGTWFRDISVAGWMHVVVMTLLLTVMFMYAVSPMPPKVVLTVSLLLMAHVLLGMVQPGWYCARTLWTWKLFGPPLVTAILVWLVAAMKLRFAKDGL